MYMQSYWGRISLILCVLFSPACGEEENSASSADENASVGEALEGVTGEELATVRSGKKIVVPVDKNPIGVNLVAEADYVPLSTPGCEVKLKSDQTKVSAKFKVPCANVGKKAKFTFSSNGLTSFKRNGKTLPVTDNKVQWSMDIAARGLRRTAKQTRWSFSDKGDELEIVDGGKTYKGKLQCDACRHLVEGLCSRKPFKAIDFGAIDKKSNDVLALAMCGTSHRMELIIGTKKPQLAHIDYVIRTKSKERNYSSCKYRSKSGDRLNLKRVATDIIMTVYDRRTGQVVKTKRVKAGAPTCPSTVPRTYGDIYNSTSTKQRRKAAWKLLRKLRKSVKSLEIDHMRR